MQYSFTLSSKDTIALHENCWRFEPEMRWAYAVGWWVPPMALLLLSFGNYCQGHELHLFLSLAYGLCWMTLWPLLMRWLHSIAFRQSPGHRHRESGMANKVAFTVGALEWEDTTGSSRIVYDAIKSVAETRDHFFLYTGSDSAVPLPKRAMPVEMQGFIRTRWAVRRT